MDPKRPPNIKALASLGTGAGKVDLLTLATRVHSRGSNGFGSSPDIYVSDAGLTLDGGDVHVYEGL